MCKRLRNLIRWIMGNIIYIPKGGCLATLPNGLVGYYKLDDTTQTIVDSAGSNDLTGTNAILEQTGLLGDCVGFDGTDRVIKGNAAHYNVTWDCVTMSFWVKFNSVTSSQKLISEFYVDTTNQHVQFTASASNTSLQLGWATFGKTSTHTWSSVLSTGVWFNITISIRISDLTFQTWVNGNIYNETWTALTSATVDKFSGRTALGRYYSSLLQPFNGYMDDLKIWNRELSQCEIEANYNSGNGIEL